LQGETSWQSTVENIMPKKLVVHWQGIHAELISNKPLQIS
jgi:homoserine trans-succinylase